MADPTPRTLEGFQRTGPATSDEVARLAIGDPLLADRPATQEKPADPLPSGTWLHRAWSPTPHLDSGDRRDLTVEKLWSSYCRTNEDAGVGLTKRELSVAMAGKFTESFQAFLNATDFLKVSTSCQIRSLGLSRRNYFYWVKRAKNGPPLRYQTHIDFKLWLVWKCLELARIKLQDEGLVATWFQTPNKLISRNGNSPIDVLFKFDVRRRPRVLRVLLDMPTPDPTSP